LPLAPDRTCLSSSAHLSGQPQVGGISARFAQLQLSELLDHRRVHLHC